MNFDGIFMEAHENSIVDPWKPLVFMEPGIHGWIDPWNLHEIERQL